VAGRGGAVGGHHHGEARGRGGQLQPHTTPTGDRHDSPTTILLVPGQTARKARPRSCWSRAKLPGLHLDRKAPLSSRHQHHPRPHHPKRGLGLPKPRPEKETAGNLPRPPRHAAASRFAPFGSPRPKRDGAAASRLQNPDFPAYRPLVGSAPALIARDGDNRWIIFPSRQRAQIKSGVAERAPPDGADGLRRRRKGSVGEPAVAERAPSGEFSARARAGGQR